MKVDPVWVLPAAIVAFGLVSAAIGKLLESEYKRRQREDTHDG